ncbi:MAG: ABC transporter substrate-binding protein [Trueperaceae bacterium]|nr:ABC transporter substrate-binding protein [Trueperaceae bacterium]
MKKILVVLALIGLSMAFAQIKVGALWNITGGMSSIDEPGYNGMQLAADQINAAGGVLGQEIQLVVIDGKTDQTANANAASRLVDVDKVAVVGGINDSTFALASGPIFQDAGIPFVIAGATLPDLPDQIGDYAFMVPFGDNIQAYAGAEFAYNDLGAKTVYVLYDTAFDYSVALRAFFKERWADLAGADSILLEDTYKNGDKDFSAQIARLKALDPQPDVLYIAAVPDDVGNLVQQIRGAGLMQPIVGGDGWDTPILTEVGGEAAENTYFTTHVSLSNTGDMVQNFVSSYTETYGNAPENAFAALGYDTMGLIADAITRAGSADSAAIRDALAATQGYSGVTGTISYEGDSRVPNKSVTVIKVENGDFVFAKEVTP